MDLTAKARVVIRGADDSLPGAFGQGCAQLLEGVVRLGSLNRAAKELGMAYSKAWRLVNEAEAHLGCKLILRDGARGSSLTADGERMLNGYRELQREVDELLARKTRELFG